MKITLEKDQHRAAAYDGEQEIGECTYSPSETIWIIDHTGVEKDYQNQGIARQLVEAVVNGAREAKVQVMATCPYALRLFRETDEFDDVVKK